MPIELSSRGYGKCPGCERWCKLVDENIEGIYKEFTCENCNRHFMVALDDENYQRLLDGKKLKPVPTEWWLYKNRL